LFHFIQMPFFSIQQPINYYFRVVFTTMRHPLHHLILPVLLLFAFQPVAAQQSWASPEVQQMYDHAEEYLAMRDYADAIITFKQAILLEPGKFILYKELGRTFYLSGNYDEAEQALEPLQGKPETDTTVYRLLASCEEAREEYKNALYTVNKGLLRFPGAAVLYFEKGKIYALESKPDEALAAWVKGISLEPTYSGNYLTAGFECLKENKVLWALLYGETYLNLPRDTTADDSVKKMLFAGWKTMFDNIPPAKTPGYGNYKEAPPPSSFYGAVTGIYSRLTPVVSDGASTENLTMVRTRFLMDWFSSAGNRAHPFSLFTYQDDLIRNGKFEIYNEWLFGKAENEVEFTAWNKFHEGDITRFLNWKALHPFHPQKSDGYDPSETE